MRRSMLENDKVSQMQSESFCFIQLFHLSKKKQRNFYLKKTLLIVFVTWRSHFEQLTLSFSFKYFDAFFRHSLCTVKDVHLLEREQ